MSVYHGGYLPSGSLTFSLEDLWNPSSPGRALPSWLWKDPLNTLITPFTTSSTPGAFFLDLDVFRLIGLPFVKRLSLASNQFFLPTVPSGDDILTKPLHIPPPPSTSSSTTLFPLRCRYVKTQPHLSRSEALRLSSLKSATPAFRFFLNNTWRSQSDRQVALLSSPLQWFSSGLVLLVT